MTTIKVKEIPNCTWELEGDCFWCTHDETEEVTFYEDHLGIDGYYETAENGLVCAECGVSLDYEPDDQDCIAESELMELLGK